MVAKASEPATVNEAPKSLAAKLAEVMGLMRAIPKEGFNKNQQYKFVRESDVAEKASQLLAERHIFILQSVVDASPPLELYRTSSGSLMLVTTVMLEFTFIDGDTGETLGPVRFAGHGADTGDKGIYKAMTGAEKYFLMKTFLVSTGDDPEADEKVDKAAAAAEASTGVRVRRGSQAGVQRGGKSTQATSAQVMEVAAMAKTLGLDSEALRPIFEEATGKKPEGDLRPWLSALPSSEIVAIIAALGQRQQAETANDDTQGEPTDDFAVV